MVRCANIRAGDCVADPFCGSGTLLLEALDVYKQQIQCIGLDVSKRSVEGSRKNARAEQYGPDVANFYCCDARGLRRHLPDASIDAMITNLPWGVVTGSKDATELHVLYEIFLRNAWYALKDGACLVMLVLRGLQVMRLVRKLAGRYRLLSVNVVRTTNNLPSLIVIEKLATDVVRDAIHRQLTHLHQFVSVSPEIYNAIHTEIVDET
jgi:tRNA G10  N-methylase Trm11